MFYYFGYGSNMNATSLRAKGVSPATSVKGELRGWRLRFNIVHFFRHEGGVANIERSDHRDDRVLGVVHLCDDDVLAVLDQAEAYRHGYDRIEVGIATADADVRAFTYVGTQEFVDDRCLPSQRYLNILVKGAIDAGLDSSYVDEIRRHAVHQNRRRPAFIHPAGDYPTFTAATLAAHPLYTALDGAVFDMSAARPIHEFLKSVFGGKDMTLFHLRRLDTSDGTETLDDIAQNRLSTNQRYYLNEYLHDYAAEYVYVGRYTYNN